jgi:hypothetical protein
MMRGWLLVTALALGGCVSTVGKVVTAPVRVAGKAVDWTTTSQDEADRNRGRQIRKAEERARKQCRRDYDDDYARDRCVRERVANEGY